MSDPTAVVAFPPASTFAADTRHGRRVHRYAGGYHHERVTGRNAMKARVLVVDDDLSLAEML
ncbi:MAG TPA: hypothetical protein VES02_13450, partial [Dermatophilaceae bacterium]|nr:hypothetical protein [Dermatophilaceae bacterium]